MHISAGCQIIYDCPQPTPMLLTISPHPSRLPDLIGPHRVSFDPPLPFLDYTDGFGNRCTRIVAPQGRTTISTKLVVQDSGVGMGIEQQNRLLRGDVQDSTRGTAGEGGTGLGQGAAAHRCGRRGDGGRACCAADGTVGLARAARRDALAVACAGDRGRCRNLRRGAARARLAPARAEAF